MYSFYELSDSVFWLPLLLFKIWMLVDALQRSGGRCGSNYWFLICWVPFGDWVYFFAVKIHDPEFAAFHKKYITRPVSVEQLRYNFRHSPSAVNKLALAEALMRAGEHSEATALLEEVVKMDSKNREANFLLAHCRQASGDLVGAAAAYERVVESDITFRNFEAASELAAAYWKTGRREEAVDFLRRLFKKSRRLIHTTELAKYLVELNQNAEAKEVLSEALDDFNHAPRYVKKQDRSAAKDANALLRAL